MAICTHLLAQDDPEANHLLYSQELTELNLASMLTLLLQEISHYIIKPINEGAYLSNKISIMGTFQPGECATPIQRASRAGERYAGKQLRLWGRHTPGCTETPPVQL